MTPLKRSLDGLYGAQDFSKETPNGLMRIRVRFGLTSPTPGEPDVAQAFREVVAELRAFADAIEMVNHPPPLATVTPIRGRPS